MSLGQKLKEALAEALPNGFHDASVNTAEEKQRIANEAAEALAEYNRKLLVPITFKQYTAEELFSFIDRSPVLKIDEHNRRVIKLLCLYFTNDERFQDFGGDLKRGLLLYGGTGVGKTTIMEFFQRNINHCFSIKPCSVIADEYARSADSVAKGTPIGREIINAYYSRLKDIVPHTGNFGQNKSGICFDDLGQEPETKHYGDSERIMGPVIEARYRIGVFNATHITTNLDGDQIFKYYGERVRSRISEMFNLIEFPQGSPDRRKQ